MTPIEVVGWALVHSLWQGALVATVLAALLRIFPPRAARARYALGATALMLMLALPLATALRLRDVAPRAEQASWTATVVERAPARALGDGATVEQASGARQDARAAGAVTLAARLRAALEPVLPWVVALWFGGVLVLSLRLTSGWFDVRRLGIVGTRPAPPACAEALARIAARLRITRPVRVLESAVVQVPAVIGWLRPIVLLPVSAVTGLTPLQLDALLAHELAHVRRYDYVVNLVQSVIETLLFYHPAVWWVSARVRAEREHCCDDIAVTVCGDAVVYARALVGMEGLRVPAPAFAVAAGGGSLLSRVRRLVTPAATELFPRWTAGLSAVTLAVTIGGGASLVGVDGGTRHQAVVPAAADGAARRATDSEPIAADTLLARIRSLRNEDARQEAVERLGRSGDATALATLIAIARDDHDEDVQREAVEALGRLNSGSALAAVADLARTHPNPEVRGEAVDVFREAAPPRVALELLRRIARRDRDAGVRREAIEGLGKLRNTLERDTLSAVLEAIALEGSDAEVQLEAVVTLAELSDPGALARVGRLARTHPNADVRRKAVDEHAEGVAPEAAERFLREVLATERSPMVLSEAVEELADLPGGIGIPALTEAAAAHPNDAVRAEARRQLSDN